MNRRLTYIGTSALFTLALSIALLQAQQGSPNSLGRFRTAPQ